MQKVDVGRKILSANEEYALKNARFLAEKKKLCLNMISSQGSGKTTLLCKTIEMLKGQLRIGVIEGDIQTEIDADRIRATQAPAIQINTEGACHLSATQVRKALMQLPIHCRLKPAVVVLSWSLCATVPVACSPMSHCWKCSRVISGLLLAQWPRTTWPA